MKKYEVKRYIPYVDCAWSNGGIKSGSLPFFYSVKQDKFIHDIYFSQIYIDDLMEYEQAVAKLIQLKQENTDWVFGQEIISEGVAEITLKVSIP